MKRMVFLVLVIGVILLLPPLSSSPIAAPVVLQVTTIPTVFNYLPFVAKSWSLPATPTPTPTSTPTGTPMATLTPTHTPTATSTPVSGCSTTPTLIGPANGSALNTLIPLFQCDCGNNPIVTEFHLHVGLDPGLTHGVWGLTCSTAACRTGEYQWRFSMNFDPSTTYYWRAYLKCGDTQGPYSEVWSFTTGSGGTILSPPTLIAPANGSTVPTTTETLQWSSVNGAVEYLLHWRQVDEEGYYFAWVSNTQYTTWFSANTIYEWWVSARNDYAIGTDSETWQFTRPAGSSPSSQGLNSSIMVESDETSTTLEECDSK